MGKLSKLVLFGILGGGWVVSALALHVVRIPGDMKPVVVTKNKLEFKETFVDARKWTLADAGSHPAVVKRLVELDKQDALGFLVEAGKGDTRTQLLEAAAKGPPVAEPAIKATPANTEPKAEPKGSENRRTDIFSDQR